MYYVVYFCIVTGQMKRVRVLCYAVSQAAGKSDADNIYITLKRFFKWTILCHISTEEFSSLITKRKIEESMFSIIRCSSIWIIHSRRTNFIYLQKMRKKIIPFSNRV